MRRSTRRSAVVLLGLGLAAACTSSDEALHLELPELGQARSMILLIEDGLHPNPFVLLTDLPFAPVRLEAEQVSLEDAQLEVALFSCPLGGLGLEPGQRRPGARSPESPMLPVASAVYRARAEEGRVLGYERQGPGAGPGLIHARDLGAVQERACPSPELQRLSVESSRGYVRLLSTLGAGRALVQFQDLSLSLLDSSGLSALEDLFDRLPLSATVQLADGRVMVVGERGRPVWLGSLEEGFVPGPEMLAEGTRDVHLAASSGEGASLEVYAQRVDSVQRFDGLGWTITSTHDPGLELNPFTPMRGRGIVWIRPGEAVFPHPDLPTGMYRVSGGETRVEPMTFDRPEDRTSFVASNPWYGPLVGVEDTSLFHHDAARGWVRFSPNLNRGNPRFATPLGRAVVLSDSHGTLHVLDPETGLRCAEVPAASSALEFGLMLEEDLLAVALERTEPQPLVALVRFSNVSPPCDRPVDD